MLRWVVGLLLVANGVYYAWTQGHLAPLGFAPTEQREPERMAGQIQPDVLHLLNAPRPADAPQPSAAADSALAPVPSSGAATASAAPAPPDEAPLPASPGDPTPAPPPLSPTVTTACWLASGFDETEADALRRALPRLGLPKGSWRLEESRSGGRWVVYMGRYNDDLMERKKEELRDLKIEFRTLTAPPLGPGLALGTFSSEDAAEQGLKNVTNKGVRSARVAQERDPSISVTLRLPSITSDERAAVQSLGSALAGKTLRSCGGGG
ncbi:SPOR domain-containing protein [Hydrogenophaga sp. PAMC20947]|uniref:SPOR domain-containing protein n=1 Tax=Hydrogenophaga sp. PAMC20947 TaxID=2565558 RepID=UPI00109DAA30|nr:SPOR domain-containing protein [Hydrogenophaga sp. PAMC20947]QCB47740.1 SPOR domain-containing protein [Hydrogenophaga sp. PAMC20947]